MLHFKTPTSNDMGTLPICITTDKTRVFGLFYIIALGLYKVTSTDGSIWANKLIWLFRSHGQISSSTIYRRLSVPPYMTKGLADAWRQKWYKCQLQILKNNGVIRTPNRVVGVGGKLFYCNINNFWIDFEFTIIPNESMKGNT